MLDVEVPFELDDEMCWCGHGPVVSAFGCDHCTGSRWQFTPAAPIERLADVQLVPFEGEALEATPPTAAERRG